MTILWSIMYRIISWSLLISLVHGHDDNILRNQTTESQTCKNASCIAKCCPENEISVNDNDPYCINNTFNSTLENIELDIYNQDIESKVAKTEKTLKDFTYIYGDFFKDRFVYDADDDKENLFILEDGRLALRDPNHQSEPWLLFTSESFCIDLQVTIKNGTPDPGSLKLAMKIVIEADPDSSKPQVIPITAMYATAGAMLVSSFFLLLVLVVYAALPQKRNLPSLILMAYVSSLAATFLARAIQLFRGVASKTECKVVGLALYYSWLASFAWMNVMAYDMWSATSKPRPPQRWRSRRNTLLRFIKFSIYGFGVPLLLTIFMVAIDFVDLTSLPRFVKPHFLAGDSCFFEKEEERQLYMNAPVVIVIAINVAFFLMTAIYIWRNSAKPGGGGDSRNTKRNANRFSIYLKLSLIMGVNWVLDVAGTLGPESWVWYPVIMFNSITGVFVFFIFIFKKKIFVLLCKRFSIECELARKWDRTIGETTDTCSTSQRKMSTPLQSPQPVANENQVFFK